MKKTILTLLLAILLLPLAAQNVEDDRRLMERILADHDNYFTAIGEHDTLEVAVSKATALLASQIQTTIINAIVEPDFSKGETQENIGQTIKDITSKSISLDGMRILTVKKPDRKSNKYKVFVYIEKSVVDDIIQKSKAEELAKLKALCDKTAEDVKHYYNEGRIAVIDLRIGDALKYWYLAYAMSLEYDGIILNDQPAFRVLETEIDKVLCNIQVNAVSCQQEKSNEGQVYSDVVLDIRYKDNAGVLRKVANLDYRYNDGYGWVNAPLARNGVGQITLRRSIDQVPLHCVYRYDENETPKDVFARINGKTTRRFASAEKTVHITDEIKQTKEAAVNPDESGQEQLLEKMQSIEKAIHGKDYDTVKPLFTEEAYHCFLSLVRRGNASVIGKPEYSFAKYGQLTICRGLILKLKFKNNKPYIEELICRFNADNLVESVAFRLSCMAENDIMEHEAWELDSRMALVTFLEDYQTAYSLGRIDYINSIFDKDIQNQYKDPQKVIYDTLRTAKMEYIKRLSHHFASKEYVKLNITETEVLQSGRDKSLFGIRLKHEYFSDVYGDSGYLFMLVDIRNGSPIVRLSVWQNDDVPRDRLYWLDNVY